MIEKRGSANVTRECIRCKEEAVCDEPGVELLTLPLKKGFWRVTGTATTLLPCPTPDACIGGTVCGANTTSSSATFFTPTTTEACQPAAQNLCFDNHHGPLCLVCTPNHYKPTRAGLCTSCTGKDSTASYSTMGGLAVAVIATLLICLYIRRHRKRAAERRATKARETGAPPEERVGRLRRVRRVIWRRLQSESLRNKCKLVISLFQVVGSFDLIFDGETPFEPAQPCPRAN